MMRCLPQSKLTNIGRLGGANRYRSDRERPVKRMIYPAGFNWATHLSNVVGTDLCMHAHVGFMARGQINVRFADGCVVEYKAPQFVAVEPGHEGWVVGDEPAVLIEFDCEGDTVEKLAVPCVHRHGHLS